MRRTGLLVLLSIVLVTGVWWMFLIGPRNTRISDLDRERTVAVDTEGRLRVQIRQLEDIRAAEVQYLAAMGTLETLIPERPLLEDFIEQVYALANDTGVELRTLAPSAPVAESEDSELREIAVSIQIEGQFFQVLGFMFGLSDMERLVRVDAVAVAASQDPAGTTVLTTSLELRLFTLADLLPVFEEPPGDDADTTTTSAAAEGGDA